MDYLESIGWLSDRTWLAAGMCPTRDLEAAGVPIGLGVDGSASNDASNLMYEARQALYLQRLKYGAEYVTPERVLDWATRGSATLIGRDDIGQIAVGKQADLALFLNLASYVSEAAMIPLPPCYCAARRKPIA